MFANTKSLVKNLLGFGIPAYFLGKHPQGAENLFVGCAASATFDFVSATQKQRHKDFGGVAIFF
jgi:hypothetical protein